ncbi:MAG TPA: phosphatase PAP2 family protein, partial [Clostridia bacterium]|nr:phosphatase PAP2 family protein [Clostridia bacterium]
LLALLLPCEAQRFLPKDCTALLELVPAPPAEDSPAGRADLETVLQVQADRTPQQVERAKRAAAQSVTSFARPVLGEWFRSSDFPKTVALFEEIGKESRTIIDDQVKKRWNRTRPYHANPAVEPVVGRPGNTSYPSGHSAAAALWGTLMAAAFPDKEAEFKAQIREAAWCRVLGGVHYPSDAVAGQMLGEAIAKAMLKEPEMQKALQTIREEVTPYLKANVEVLAK